MINVRWQGMFLATYLLLAGCNQDTTTPVAATEPVNEIRSSVDTSKSVIVYASGGEVTLRAVLDAYRAETGIDYEILADDSSRLPDLLNYPNRLPNADLYIGNSLAEIWAVAEADELRPTFSDAISNNIRAELRDPESRWTALSIRSRIIVYNPARVTAGEIAEVQSYAALGDGRWRNRLCLSSSGLAGNRLLVAYLVHKHDIREAEIIVRRWRANLASNVYVDDIAVIQAVASDDCDIAIADSSKFESYKKASPGTAVAAHWFTLRDNRLIDFRGAGVNRHANNPAAAVALLEWLTAKDANALFAFQSMEFPANLNAPSASEIAAQTEYVRDARAAINLGFLQEDAQKLIERARYP